MATDNNDGLWRDFDESGFFITAISVSLAACTDSIKMKNAQTAQIAQCGPYESDMWVGGNTRAQRETHCIQDFQRQDYERMP
jgi:hypothetical protein